MSEIPELLRANEAFAAAFDGRELARPPRRRVAVLTCIDARIDPSRLLGLDIGDAHVLRNAGARATDDVLRSLLISTWLMGTREVLVIHHTDCGLAGTTDRSIAAQVRTAGGPDVTDFPFLSFADPEGCLREDVEAIRGLGDRLPAGVRVSGHVYDVRTGVLRQDVPA
jgi:carbonic anhydrase